MLRWWPPSVTGIQYWSSSLQRSFSLALAYSTNVSRLGPTWVSVSMIR